LEDQKGYPQSNEGKTDRGLLEGERQGEGGDGPGSHKNDCVEEVELDPICPWSWKGGSWVSPFKKVIPHSTFNGKFDVAQKGA